jgi:N-acetyl-alpha-D-muramate 1-phosphate uridylyltransferase
MNESLPSVAILAGGLATRLQSVTQNIPKALVDIGGIPFIVHQLELLKRHGMNQVVVCAGYLGEMIRQAIGNGQRFQMTIDYSFDAPGLLGTGGAIVHALPLLSDPFLVLYGDSYLECDYQSIWKAFLSANQLGMMTVFRNEDRWDLSNVEFQNGKIISYNKVRRGPAMEYIDYGLGVFSKKGFQDFTDGTSYDLAQVYERLIQLEELAGYEVFERFYEIGSPEGLEETRAHLVSKNSGIRK